MSSTVRRSLLAFVAVIAVQVDADSASACTVSSDCGAGQQCMLTASVCFSTPGGFAPNAGQGVHECPPGTYAPLQSNNPKCINCEAGKYQEEPQSATCTPCPSGKTSPEAATNTSDCVAATTITTTVMDTVSETDTVTDTTTFSSTGTETATGTMTITASVAPILPVVSMPAEVPILWMRINNLDLSQLKAAGAVNQVCDALRISTAQRVQVVPALVFCELFSGSVLAKVWINQQDPILQTKLRDAQEAITTDALEQVKTLPALGAVSTGMLSAEYCGGDVKAVCSSAAVLPTGSMPSSVEAAQILGNARAMIKQEIVVVNEPPHLPARSEFFVPTSFIAGLIGIFSLRIWARSYSEEQDVLEQDPVLVE